MSRRKKTSARVPGAALFVLAVLTLLPAGAAAQCPAVGPEGSTFGTTKFNTVKSQMWFNDGRWWGAFSDNDFGIYFYSFPNNATTKGPIIDGNINGIPDVLWDGTNLFVIIWKSVSLSTLYKYTYNSTSKSYALVSGFPVQIPLNGSSTSAIVLAKDSTGKLWATYTGTQGGLSDGTVRVIWTTSADHKTWNTTGFVLETGLAPNVQEISTITAFGGNKIGVAWSNQPGMQIGFRYHVDGQAENSWSAKELVDSGKGPRNLGPVADDHLAIKAAPDGRLFLAAKDNDNDGTPARATEGRVWMYIRSAAGVWGQKTIVQPDFSQLPTRPVLMLDVENNNAYVIYHDESPAGGGRDYIARSSMDSPGFDFPCVLFNTPSANATSTKQNLTTTMGLMVASSTGSTGTNELIFRSVDLTPPPPPAPTLDSLSPSSASAGGAGFTLTINGRDFVQRSVLRWNGSDRPTTFVSATQLTAQISSADIAAAGSAAVTVFTSAPGGGLSNQVSFPINSAGFECDVAPRSSAGNGSVTISDWVQVGRFVSGLDAANAGAEFQKADSAPKSSLGNGSLTISDWVQCGRYAAGLDTPVPAMGGPSSPGAALSESFFSSAQLAAVSTGGNARVLRLAGARLAAGQKNSVAVVLDARGGENALGFSLSFDPKVLSFVGAAAGAAGATLNVNASEAARGRIGFALALPTGSRLGAGPQQLIVLTFAALPGAQGSTTIGFGDHPVRSEVVDAFAIPAGTFVPQPQTFPVVGVRAAKPAGPVRRPSSVRRKR